MGKKGTGKTNLLKWFCKAFPNHLIWDYNNELDGKIYKAYKPTRTPNDEDLQREFSDYFVNKAVKPRLKLIDFAGIEESDRVIPTRRTLTAGALDLIHLSRHYQIGTCWCARRFSDLNVSAAELADYYFIFKQTGINDLKRLDEILEGLADVMRAKISTEQHNFIFTDGEKYSIEKVVRIE